MDYTKKISLNLSKTNKKNDKKILLFNINNHWNKDKYKKLMSKLIFPLKYKLGIIKALKEGILDELFLPNNSIGQNHDLLSLLVSIVLEGLEELCKKKETKTIQISSNFSPIDFRYGNKLFYIVDLDDNERELLKTVKSFLIDRGFELTGSISINLKDGFDFLGFHFIIKHNDQITIYPSKDNWKLYKNEIKSALKRSR